MLDENLAFFFDFWQRAAHHGNSVFFTYFLRQFKRNLVGTLAMKLAGDACNEASCDLQGLPVGVSGKPPAGGVSGGGREPPPSGPSVRAY